MSMIAISWTQKIALYALFPLIICVAVAWLWYSNPTGKTSQAKHCIWIPFDGSTRYHRNFKKVNDKIYYVWSDEPLPDVNTETFKLSWPYSSYGKDDKHVYCDDKLMAPADASTFCALSSTFGADSYVDSYAKDASNIYFECDILSGADRASFRTINPVEECGEDCLIDARDNNHAYNLGKIVPQRATSSSL